MNNKIGIILTSIERPQALKESVESILSVWQDNWVLLIGLQDEIGSESDKIIDKIICDNPDKHIREYYLEYDCGISVARNELIHHSYLLGCEYTLLTADTILFDTSMKDIDILLSTMELGMYKLVGLELNNRVAWEAYLDLINYKCFELDFIDSRTKLVSQIVDCDIVRNFWIAKTEYLKQVPYDEQLKACEHEDFFWRWKGQNYSVGCTNLCSGTYKKPTNIPKYDEIRSKNFRIGQQRLKDKYSLTSWISYKNLDRIKQ